MRSLNPFKPKEPHYERSIIVPLPMPSDNTVSLVNAALAGLKSIYKDGYQYKKSGVQLMGLHSKLTIQNSLFDNPNEQAKADNLMKVIDSINQKMGRGSIVLASAGVRQNWSMKRERKSPNFTTDWRELPIAH